MPQPTTKKNQESQPQYSVRQCLWQFLTPLIAMLTVTVVVSLGWHLEESATVAAGVFGLGLGIIIVSSGKNLTR